MRGRGPVLWFWLLLLPASAGPGVAADGDAAPSAEVAPAPAAAGEEALDVFRDPEFQKRFLGTYGIHSEVEPRLTPLERDLLQRILPHMASNPAEAIRLLESGMKKDASAILDFTLGNLHFQQGDMEQAAGRYRIAVAKFPNFRRAHRNLGLVEVRQGRNDEAIRSFARTIELGGGDAILFGLLGYSYTARGDFLAAEAAYRSALLLQPDNDEWRLGLARCIFKQHKHQEAVALLDVLLERHSDRADFWLLQANAFVALKQPLRAAENLEVVRRLGKATPDSQFLLGDIYVNEGLTDLAAGAYAAALAIDPAQPAGRALRSTEGLVARGAMPQGRALASRIREVLGERLTGDEKRSILRLEARAAVAGGDGGDAVRLLEEVVVADPLDGEALMLLADHYARSADPDRALLYFERAANLGSHEAAAKIRQAQILVGRGKYQEALPLLRRAQEIRPREEISRYLEQVERLARTRG
ncbi:MAG: tetratricopeptide repeat protein [Candidatus Polarisedimenticolia bacterium]